MSEIYIDLDKPLQPLIAKCVQHQSCRCFPRNILIWFTFKYRDLHSEVNTHHVLIRNKIRVELLNGVSKQMFYFHGLILLLKLKKAENVTCLNWKFPVLSDVKLKDRTERHAVAAVCFILWRRGYEYLPGYRSLFVGIFHAFALRQTQAHTDKRYSYTHCHQSAAVRNCWCQRTQSQVSVIHSSFSQLISVRTRLQWGPPFSRSCKNPVTLRHRQSTTYAAVTLRKSRPKSNFAPLETDYTQTFCELCTERTDTPDDTQTQTHRKPIGRSKTAPPPICHRPAVAFLLPLIIFSLPQEKIRHVSQELLF